MKLLSYTQITQVLNKNKKNERKYSFFTNFYFSLIVIQYALDAQTEKLIVMHVISFYDPEFSALVFFHFNLREVTKRLQEYISFLFLSCYFPAFCFFFCFFSSFLFFDICFFISAKITVARKNGGIVLSSLGLVGGNLFLNMKGKPPSPLPPFFPPSPPHPLPRKI